LAFCLGEGIGLVVSAAVSVRSIGDCRADDSVIVVGLPVTCFRLSDDADDDDCGDADGILLTYRRSVDDEVTLVEISSRFDEDDCSSVDDGSVESRVLVLPVAIDADGDFATTWLGGVTGLDECRDSALCTPLSRGAMLMALAPFGNAVCRAEL